MFASPPLILGKSRVRKRARTDLCGGRSAMVVPTATVTLVEVRSTELADDAFADGVEDQVGDAVQV
jgi:hypothetical protein